jgi:hypothetical protein
VSNDIENGDFCKEYFSTKSNIEKHIQEVHLAICDLNKMPS